MKRLLYTSFAGFPNPNTGGQNKVIYELLKCIDKNVFEVFYLSKHAMLNKHNFINNGTKINIKVSTKSYVTNYLFYKNSIYRKLVTNPVYLNYHFRKTEKYFAKKVKFFNDIDIVHSHDPFSLFFFAQHNCRKLLTVHSKGSLTQDMKDYFGDSIFLSNFYKRMTEMEKYAFEAADIITFPSNAAKDLYLNNLKINDSSKIQIVYNGVDTESIKDITIDEEVLKRYDLIQVYDLKILNVADHIKVKNVNKVIEVLNILKRTLNRNPILVNIGSGPETDNLKNLAAKYNLSSNIRFLGKIPNNDVIKLMKWFDCFLILSERVVFDMVILEALASKLLVIANDDGGNKEIITNRINGFLVNPFDVEEICNIIINNYKNNTIKENSIDSLNNFTISKMYNNFELLYNEVKK